MVLAKERTATAPSQAPMDEEERHALPGDFIVHVKAIDAVCRHTVLCYPSPLDCRRTGDAYHTVAESRSHAACEVVVTVGQCVRAAVCEVYQAAAARDDGLKV